MDNSPSPATPTPTNARGLRARSSLADDVWHRLGGAGAYEWWYFDAISDDGRDAVVVIFLADFVFSPRHNAAGAARARDPSGATALRPPRFPAVTFFLYRDGRPLMRAVNEYSAEEFTASTSRPACRIGASSFRLEADGRGRRFVLSLDEPFRGSRRLAATFEWHVVEGDYSAGGADSPSTSTGAAHDWNLVAPRCRVSGDYALLSAAGAACRGGGGRFRGIGYHDHNSDTRWMPATVAAWQWGRCHFADATAVFYRYREAGERAAATRLFLVRDGTLSAHDAAYAESGRRRDVFGLGYPRHMDFAAEGVSGAARLTVGQQRVVDSSYFYLRFVGEAALELGDGRVRRAPLLAEHLAPRALRWRRLDWLTDMRIGRRGRASFLP